MTKRKITSRPDAFDVEFRQAVPIEPLDIGALLRVIWHGKALILSVLMITLALAGYYAFRVASPQYAATATLHLDATTRPLSAVARQSAATTVNDMALNTTVALVTSDAVLSKAIATLDLRQDPEFNRYLRPAPPFALSTLRTTARNILAGTSEQAPTDTAINEKTIQNLRGALTVSRQTDTYILQITAQSGDPAKAGQIANMVAATFLSHVEGLQRQAAQNAEIWLQTRVTELRNRLEAQERQITNLRAAAQIQDDSALDDLGAQVLRVDQALSEARNDLANLENAADGGSARNAAGIVQTQTEIREIMGLKERLGTQLSAQSEGLAQLHQIQLQADATRQLYQSFLVQLQENRIQQGQDAPNAHQIAPANQARYVGPRKLLILAIAALLGGTFGVGLVALGHLSRKGAIDPRVLHDETGLPVLSQISTLAMRQMRKGRRALPLPPHTALSQTTNALWTALTLSKAAKVPQVVLTTSSIQNEGKSTQAIALAHRLAAAEKSVVLISMDAHDGTLRSVVGTATFTQCQSNWATAQPYIYHAPLGADVIVLPTMADHGGTYLADQMPKLLETLRASHDHIIVDAPPVLQSVDAQVIAAQADAIIYTVRWAKTPLALVRRGLAVLDSIGYPATGLLLTKINNRKMRKLSTDPYINLVQPAYFG